MICSCIAAGFRGPVRQILLLVLVFVASAGGCISDSGALRPAGPVLRLRGGNLASFLAPITSFGFAETPAPAVESAGGLASWLPFWSDSEDEDLSMHSEEAESSADDKKDVRQESSTAASVESTIVINAPLRVVFDAATNYEDYPRWTAGCSNAKVLSRRTGSGLAKQVDFTMGAFGITSQNIMQYDYDVPRRMSWTVTKGSVKELHGVYEFKELSGGRTEVLYKLRVDPGVPMPKMLRIASSKAVAAAALSDLKKWCEKSVRDVQADDHDAAAPLSEPHHAPAFRELVPI